jgi:MFS family permease
MRLSEFLINNARWLGAGVLLMFMSSFGQTFFISIFAEDIQREFGLSHGAWGSIYAIGTTASAAAMIWAGVLADVYRVRLLGAICLVGLAASCIFMAVNPTVLLLPVVIFCLRMTGQGMASHVAVVAMSRWFVATRGRALAVTTFGYSLGEMILPITFVFLMALTDWHWLWVLSAGICVLAAGLLQWLLQKERTPSAMNTENERFGMEGRHWTRKEVLSTGLFWMFMPAIIGLSAFGTAYLFHQVAFSSIKGIEHLTFVALLPIYSVTAVIMTFVSGIALDRVGTLRLMPYYLLPVACSFLISGYANSVAGIALGLAVFGLTTGSHGTLTNALWAELYGTAHIGSVKAVAAAAMVFGSAIGPAITGVLMDIGVSLEDQYKLISLYFLATSALIYYGVRRARQRFNEVV